MGGRGVSSATRASAFRTSEGSYQEFLYAERLEWWSTSQSQDSLGVPLVEICTAVSHRGTDAANTRAILRRKSTAS